MDKLEAGRNSTKIAPTYPEYGFKEAVRGESRGIQSLRPTAELECMDLCEPAFLALLIRLYCLWIPIIHSNISLEAMS